MLRTLKRSHEQSLETLRRAKSRAVRWPKPKLYTHPPPQTTVSITQRGLRNQYHYIQMCYCFLTLCLQDFSEDPEDSGHYTTIDDAFSSLLETLSTTSHQCHVSDSVPVCCIRFFNTVGLLNVNMHAKVFLTNLS